MLIQYKKVLILVLYEQSGVQATTGATAEMITPKQSFYGYLEAHGYSFPPTRFGSSSSKRPTAMRGTSKIAAADHHSVEQFSLRKKVKMENSSDFAHYQSRLRENLLGIGGYAVRSTAAGSK